MNPFFLKITRVFAIESVTLICCCPELTPEIAAFAIDSWKLFWCTVFNVKRHYCWKEQILYELDVFDKTG